MKKQRFPRPGSSLGFSCLSLELLTLPTLLAPLAALGGQTKRRMFVRKVTKINKSETPTPTTWPKAHGVHTRCFTSAAPFPPHRFFLPTLAWAERNGKAEAGAPHGRPEERLGSAHSVACGPAARLRCRGRRPIRQHSSWTLLPPPPLPTVSLKAFNAAAVKSESFLYFVSVFGAKQSMLKSCQRLLSAAWTPFCK